MKQTQEKPIKILENLDWAPSFDPVAYEQQRADLLNEEVGNLGELDCPVCKNRGYVARVIGGGCQMVACDCLAKRHSMRRLRESGLEKMVHRCTFAAFCTQAPWQKAFLQSAVEYAQNSGGRWYFAGGQVGCGKSHLCTAICSHFLENGQAVRYVVWREEATRLKGMINEAEAYHKQMDALKNVPVLYLDDLFKTQRGQGPTAADVNLAFDLLNGRYVRDLETVISSEHTLDGLMAIDEGIGSRIYEKARTSNFIIGPDQGKNYRLKP